MPSYNKGTHSKQTISGCLEFKYIEEITTLIDLLNPSQFTKSLALPHSIYGARKMCMLKI